MKRSDFLLSPLVLIFNKKNVTSSKIEKINKEFSNYNEVSHYFDGTLMSDSKCDGSNYVKVNGKYFLTNETRVDVKTFGVKGDGIADDYIGLQKAIDFCIKTKKSLYLSRPQLSYLSSKKLVIKSQLYIFGDGLSLCGINFLNSDGFEISEGVRNVIIEKISINQAIRDSNKQNNFIGLRIKGTNKNRPYTHIVRDILIDGFCKGIECSWIWDSLFDNIKTVFGRVGVEILGTSVNNVISNSSISLEGINSKGIFFSDKVNPTEGWRINNILIFAAETAIHSFYTSNVYVTTPILDFCSKYGILLESGIGPSTNWQILGGYIAMSGKNGEAGVSINTNVNNNQIRGCKVSNVDILVYPNSVSKIGISIMNKINKNDSVMNNSISGFLKEIKN